MVLLPSLCSPSYLKPSRLGLGEVTGEARPSAIYNGKSPAYNDYALFMEGPPCSEVEVGSHLLNLCQGNQLLCHFLSEFRTLAAKLNWGDAALQSFFMAGLLDYI